MRVVHISTQLHGGAGLAALRLHRALGSQGITSRMLSLHPPPIPAADMTHVRGILRRATEGAEQRFFDRSGWALGARTRQRRTLRHLRGRYELFSFPTSPYRLEGHRWVKQADVVHLHWVAGLLDIPTFFARLPARKPLVWTLHDMNPFLGGFHYQGDFDRNPALQPLDLKLRALKERAYHRRPVQLVTLSQWMTDALQGSILENAPATRVPNGLDTSLFCYGERDAARARLGLSRDERVFLFVSETVDNHRKGFDLLLRAIADLPSQHVVRFVAIGATPHERTDSRLLFTGRIDNPIDLADHYRSADLFVLPSREDNLPNVMLESLCCGCPVLSFAVGGMRDVVDDENGLLELEATPEGLRAGLVRFLETESGRFNRRLISDRAHQRFGATTQASRMASLYEHVRSK